MRLSEAIQLGAMMTSQAFRTLFKGDGACALGAALLAVGVAPEQAERSVRKRWPWAFAVNVNCPSCARSRLVCQVVVHLHADHRWTRARHGLTWGRRQRSTRRVIGSSRAPEVACGIFHGKWDTAGAQPPKELSAANTCRTPARYRSHGRRRDSPSTI